MLCAIRPGGGVFLGGWWDEMRLTKKKPRDACFASPHPAEMRQSLRPSRVRVGPWRSEGEVGWEGWQVRRGWYPARRHNSGRRQLVWRCRAAAFQHVARTYRQAASQHVADPMPISWPNQSRCLPRWRWIVSLLPAWGHNPAASAAAAVGGASKCHHDASATPDQRCGRCGHGPGTRVWTPAGS